MIDSSIRVAARAAPPGSHTTGHVGPRVAVRQRQGLRLMRMLVSRVLLIAAACVAGQTQQRVQALECGSIHMVDRKNGWAQNLSWVSTDKAIWKTTDGGKSWKQVLCAIPGKLEGNISACFRDSKTAWVAASDFESAKVTVFRTTDGGRYWARNQLNQSPLSIPLYYRLQPVVFRGGGSLADADSGPRYELLPGRAVSEQR